MNDLNKTILEKSNIVHRQYILNLEKVENNKEIWDDIKENLKFSYSEKIPKIIKDFFSNDKELQKKGFNNYKSLLDLTQWDSIDDTFNNNEKKDKFKDNFKDNFVDNFNNFSEFYDFLIDLIKNVEEYEKFR